MLTRALLALLAMAVLLLPLPLGEQVTDAGAACCGEVAIADVAADVDECCDDCDEPTVSEDDDATHHPCCSDGCHCACCGRLPLDVTGPPTTSAPAPARRAVTRLARAPGDPAPLAIFDPPRA